MGAEKARRAKRNRLCISHLELSRAFLIGHLTQVPVHWKRVILTRPPQDRRKKGKKDALRLNDCGASGNGQHKKKRVEIAADCAHWALGKKTAS